MDYNFYKKGENDALKYWENTKKIADEIEKEFGLDARLEYECGLSIALSRTSIDTMDANLSSLKDMYGHSIETDPDFRNNSYFGTAGVSKMKDIDGNYNDPEKHKTR